MKAVPWRRMAPDVASRVRVCAELAETYMKTGEYDKAIDSLHDAIRLQPANSAIRSQLERCHAMKNHFRRVERGAQEVPPVMYISARHATDATGYGKLPAATTAVMAAALMVLSWQYITVTLDEKVPAVPTVQKKRITPASSRSSALSRGITLEIPRTKPPATSMAGVSDASPHSRYSSAERPGQSPGGASGTRVTYDSTLRPPDLFR